MFSLNTSWTVDNESQANYMRVKSRGGKCFFSIGQDWGVSRLPVAQHDLRGPPFPGSQGLRHRDDHRGLRANPEDALCLKGCDHSRLFSFQSVTPSLNHPTETDKSDAFAEIVEVIDDSGYSRFTSGPFVVPRSCFFGLITIQEPFDPQLDLGWMGDFDG